MKIIHKSMSMEYLRSLFKGSMGYSVIKGELPDDAFLIHHYYDTKCRVFRLFFTSVIRGTEIQEGMDITNIAEEETVMKYKS